ncbi:MAG: cell envelope integrity protein TolA [Bilophila sp.]
MHFGSYSISILLHVGLALLVLLWPSSPPLKLDQPMMQISLTMGAPGGNKLPSAVLGPQGRPNPSQAAPKPAPAQEASGAVPVPREDTVQPKPEPQRESRPKPQPKPDAVAIAEKKEKKKPETPKDDPEEEAPKPKEKPKEKQPDKPTKAKESDKPTKAKVEPSKPSDVKKAGKAPSSQDALKAALADAAKQAGPRKSRTGSTSIAGALADFEKTSKSAGQGGGGGGEGDGPGGGGIYDVYAGMVILAVRPNWSMPTYSRTVLVVQVKVKVDPRGEVLDCSIARSSGRAEFDASAVNAVVRTKVLPPPPTPDQQEMVLTFNSQEMMGK